MPQDSRLQVLAPAIGIDQRTVLIARHGVDGQIATRQVLFQGDRSGGIERETVVAGPHLALGSCNGVFVAGFRVKENGKVLAHLLVAQAKQVLGSRADHDPVPLADRKVQQRIPDGASDFVDLHGLMIT